MRQATRKQRPASTTEGEIEYHMPWARALAVEVSRSYLFDRRSQEEDDIISVAYYQLCKRWEMFDRSRGTAFRGYARQQIETECRREARRLRNGGMYNTRREIPGVCTVVAAASVYDTEEEDFDVEDYRRAY